MGNIWKFSDQLDEVDLAFAQHDFVSYNMASDYYELSLKKVTRLAWECGAVYKIGNKKVLIKRSIFEDHLRKIKQKSEEENYV